MRHILLCTLILCLSCLSASGRQGTSPKKQNSKQQTLTAEDFLQGRIDRGSGRDPVTLLVGINHKLPPYRFHLIPGLSAEHGDRHPIGRVEISRGDSDAILQTLTVEADVGASWLTRSFKAEDVNFDGYLDIAVLKDFGAKWGSYGYWLFDKRSGRFVTNSLTAALGSLSFNEMSLDAGPGQIHLSNMVIGCADSTQTYRVAGGRLTLLRAEEREAEERYCRVRIKRRVGRRMKLVAERRESRREM